MGRPERNFQFQDGYTLHRDITSADSALTSASYAAQATVSTPSGAYATNRAATVAMRVWLADSGNDSGNGGDTCDIYIVGWPYPTLEDRNKPTLGGSGSVRAAAELVGAFEITSATSTDNAAAHITDTHPITGAAVTTTDFFEAELADFDDFITSGSQPTAVKTYSAAGAAVASNGVDGLGLPIRFLIDTTAYEYIKVFVTALGGDADRCVVALRRVD